jgi:hypothetical protein
MPSRVADVEGVPELFLTPDSARQASVDLSAAYTPNTAEAGAKVRWQVFDGSNQPVGTGGAFGGGNPVASLAFTNPEQVLTIGAGVDANDDGALQLGEVARQLQVAQRTAVLLNAQDGQAEESAEMPVRNGNVDVFVKGTDPQGIVVQLPATVTAVLSPATPLPAGATLTFVQAVQANGSVKLTFTAAGFTAGGTYRFVMDIADTQQFTYQADAIDIIVP